MAMLGFVGLRHEEHCRCEKVVLACRRGGDGDSDWVYFIGTVARPAGGHLT